MIHDFSSAGLALVYLNGVQDEEEHILVRAATSCQYCAEEFRNTVQNIRQTASPRAQELFCILGVPKKVQGLSEHITSRIRSCFLALAEGLTAEDPAPALDLPAQTFYDLLYAHLFPKNSVRFPRHFTFSDEDWCAHCFYGTHNPEENRSQLVNSIFSIWCEQEQPQLLGKQLMCQSFLRSDLTGRKIVGSIWDPESGSWNAILSGGLILRSDSDLPYRREKVDVRQAGFTVSGVESILCKPAYAYGEFFAPAEVYEGWHKVFLYTAALTDVLWTQERLSAVFERFLAFLSEHICEIIPAEPMIDKSTYFSTLLRLIEETRSFLRGEESEVISRDFLMLIDNRYTYLPYLFDLFEASGIRIPSGEPRFLPGELRALISASESEDTYQKGLQWENTAAYVLEQIPDFRITGRRVNAGYHEIDLSVVNIGENTSLWALGAYILVECKNWKEKVGVSVVRGLGYIGTMKGNKTVLLFAASGITPEAKAEILRLASEGIFMLVIDKTDLCSLTCSADCKQLILDKFEILRTTAQEIMVI